MSDEPTDSRDRLEYHHEEDTYRIEYTDETNPPSVVVVEAIGTITEQDTRDLDPLGGVVDPNALDALFQPTVDGDYRSDGEVSFTYHGYEVAVRSYGVIAIRPADDEE